MFWAKILSFFKVDERRWWKVETPIVIGALRTIPKGLVKGLENRNQKTSGDHPDYSIIKNTEKSLEDLRRLTVTQTPMKDHQLMLV